MPHRQVQWCWHWMGAPFTPYFETGLLMGSSVGTAVVLPCIITASVSSQQQLIMFHLKKTFQIFLAGCHCMWQVLLLLRTLLLLTLLDCRVYTCITVSINVQGTYVRKPDSSSFSVFYTPKQRTWCLKYSHWEYSRTLVPLFGIIFSINWVL